MGRWVGEGMDVWKHIWIDRQMNGWIDGQMGEWMSGWKHGWINERMDLRKDGQMNGQKEQWMGRKKNGKMDDGRMEKWVRRFTDRWKNVYKDAWMESWVDGWMDPSIWSCQFSPRAGVRVINSVNGAGATTTTMRRQNRR